MSAIASSSCRARAAGLLPWRRLAACRVADYTVRRSPPAARPAQVRPALHHSRPASFTVVRSAGARPPPVRRCR